jgi:hypothetical protein
MPLSTTTTTTTTTTALAVAIVQRPFDGPLRRTIRDALRPTISPS